MTNSGAIVPGTSREKFLRAEQNFTGVLFSPNQRLFFVLLSLYLIGRFKGTESCNLKQKINYNILTNRK